MDVDEIIKNLNLKFRNIEGEKLILAITSDENKNVLMVAFMNEEALKETLKTGYMHYYSTSRKKLWRKGEESGNVPFITLFQVHGFSHAQRASIITKCIVNGIYNQLDVQIVSS